MVNVLASAIPQAIWDRWIPVDLDSAAGAWRRRDAVGDAQQLLSRAVGEGSPTAGCLLVGGYGTGKSVALAHLERGSGASCRSLRCQGRRWQDVLLAVEAPGQTLLVDGLDELVDPPDLRSVGQLLDRVGPRRAVLAIRDTLLDRWTAQEGRLDVRWPEDRPVLQLGGRGVELYSVAELSDVRLRQYLSRRFPAGDQAGLLLERLTAIYDLADLARRFVLLDAVCAIVEGGEQDVLAELHRREQIYDRAIDGLCRREAARALGLAADTLRGLLERVAEGRGLDGVPPALREALDATGLVHDGQLTHASFGEYLWARAWIRRAAHAWRQLPAPDENRLAFLAELPETKTWLESLRGAVPPELARTVLDLARHSGAVLREVAFSTSDRLAPDLRGLRVVSSDLGQLDFTESDLGPIDLTGSNLTDAKWDGARPWPVRAAAEALGVPVGHELLIRVEADTALLDLAERRVRWGSRSVGRATVWFDGRSLFELPDGATEGTWRSGPGWEKRAFKSPTSTASDGARSPNGRQSWWRDGRQLLVHDGRSVRERRPVPTQRLGAVPATLAWEALGHFWTYEHGELVVWTGDGRPALRLGDLGNEPVVGTDGVWYQVGASWHFRTPAGEGWPLALPRDVRVVPLPGVGFAAVEEAGVGFHDPRGERLAHQPVDTRGATATGHVVRGAPLVALVGGGPPWLRLVHPDHVEVPDWVTPRLEGIRHPPVPPAWMGFPSERRSRIPKPSADPAVVVRQGAEAAAPGRYACFISHSRSDEPASIFVCALERLLAERGRRAFVDVRGIEAGAEWEKTIGHHARSLPMVVVVSESGDLTQWQRREVGAAPRKFPVRLGSKIPREIEHLQAFDASLGFGAVADAIEAWLRPKQV